MAITVDRPKNMPRKQMAANLLNTASAYIWLLPAIILFTTFTFYPFVKTIYLTFFLTNAAGQPVRFVGLNNYIRIFGSEGFSNTLFLTFKFAALVGLGTFVMSMFLALLAASKQRGGRIYEIMFSLPMAVASAAASIIWNFVFAPRAGVMNYLLGTQFLWLSDTNLALYVVALVTIWSGIGASFIFLMVGFRNVPTELLESAAIDGASPLDRVFKILIPLASPQIFFVIFLNIAGSFQAFAQIRLLTRGGPLQSTNVLIYSVYDMAFNNNRFESACVLALTLFVIIFLVTRIQFYFEKKVVY